MTVSQRAYHMQSRLERTDIPLLCLCCIYQVPQALGLSVVRLDVEEKV